MVIFELEDFDYWVDNSIVTEGGIYVFSPLFVYLIYWAFCENKLNPMLLDEQSFIDELSNLKNDNSSFSNFVNNQLDGKMCDSYFDDSVKKFMFDYFEYDGYSKDLSKCFRLNLWELPNSLDKAKEFNQFINASLCNYERNLKINPEIINFSAE